MSHSDSPQDDDRSDISALHERLAAANEELTSVNQELEDAIAEFRQVNSDLQNLTAATGIATMFLDADLDVRRYTPAVERLFNLEDADVDGVLDYVTDQLAYDEVARDLRQVLEDGTVIEREVQHIDSDEWFSARLRPYRSIEDTNEGAVFTLVDVTERHEMRYELEALNDSLEARVKARTDQVRRLASELVLAEQSERDRIARLLHDGLQQTLVGIKFRLQMMSPGDRTAIAQICDQMDEAISQTRDLSVDLSPPALEGEDFAETMEWLSQEMKDVYGLMVRRQESVSMVLPEDKRVLLFQLVRELLLNVIQHAGVDEAVLVLEPGEELLTIRVADEGSGFNPERQERTSGQTSGSGLQSVRRRLELFGGALTIDSAVGQGTAVTLTIPWSSGLDNDVTRASHDPR